MIGFHNFLNRLKFGLGSLSSGYTVKDMYTYRLVI